EQSRCGAHQASARGASERESQQAQDGGGQHPPGGDPRAGEQRGQPKRNRDPERREPVIAHEELPDPEQDADDRTHAGSPTIVRRGARRSQAPSASDTSSTPGMSASSAPSPPGQLAPALSAPQKVLNDVSITLTAYFIVFSGTR